VAAILNDALVGAYGVEAVRVSLTVTLTCALAGISLMLYAARRLPHDLEYAEHRGRIPLKSLRPVEAP